MEENYKYVWLNLNTGEFSNSWDEKTHELIDEQMISRSKANNWKLIKYSCINENSFEFYNKMKIVTKQTNTPSSNKK